MQQGTDRTVVFAPRHVGNGNDDGGDPGRGVGVDKVDLEIAAVVAVRRG